MINPLIPLAKYRWFLFICSLFWGGEVAENSVLKDCKVFYLAGAITGSSSLSSDSRATVKLVANRYNGITFADPFVLIPYGLVELQDSTVTYNFPIPSGFPAGVVVGL